MGVIYLVRHAQATAAQYGGRANPTENGALTTLGRAQARELGHALAARLPSIDVAVSGTLPRQQQTLDIVLQSFAAPVRAERDARWNEYDYSGVVGGQVGAASAHGAELQGIVDHALEEWVTGGPGKDEDETFARYTARCIGAVDDLTRRLGAGRTALVASSSGTITRIVAEVWGVEPAAWIDVSRTMLNASVTKLISGRRGLSVVSVNEHAHLDADRPGGGRPLMTYR